jgi:hypothetical protein
LNNTFDVLQARTTMLQQQFDAAKAQHQQREDNCSVQTKLLKNLEHCMAECSPIELDRGTTADGQHTPPLTASTSLSDITSSPFLPGTVATRIDAPAASAAAKILDRNVAREFVCNPLYDKPASGLDAFPSHTACSFANAVPQSSALPTLADKCTEPAVLVPYLDLINAIIALIGTSANAPLPTSVAPIQHVAANVALDGQQLQQRVAAAEVKLATVCADMAAISQQLKTTKSSSALGKAVPACGGHDIMCSFSGSGSPTSPLGSPCLSGMARLSHIIALLLDGHEKQVGAFEGHGVGQGGHTQAVAACPQRLVGMKQLAEDAQEELRRLKEVTSQQEVEVAIQWNEKQQLQQKAHSELASATQVRDMAEFGLAGPRHWGLP